ncbi:hypothetical protein [Paenibacillus xylaniclasticus]|uniref:hypothetical protein n=1 Tax=Paenibacillus xylaniclasticus TaxID=588083 RepID=UPI000FDAFB03|nr:MULTISPECIES: hypothetical protein [Paenibacillus]GFN31695.1 hypothetical protein PCURB6_19550 [Paenibacillus curdlanolyticus]
MNRKQDRVPFGYEPAAEPRNGTLVYYDWFEETSDAELEIAAEAAANLSFRTLVLYPLHEATAKRMMKQPISPYYKRMDKLHDWRRSQVRTNIRIDGLEGKRKKYTPIDSAFRHLIETYGSPLFLYLTPSMANLIASFDSFESWIIRIRLLLASEPSARELHPRLAAFAHRWDVYDSGGRKAPQVRRRIQYFD